MDRDTTAARSGFPPPAPIPAEPPMPPDIGVTIDDLMAGARRALDAMQSATENIAGISASATSEDGEVSVTVSAIGEMTDLQISEAAMSLAPAQLAELVVSTAQVAAGEAFGAMGQQITELNERLHE